MDYEILQALKRLIKYIEADEKKHWEENGKPKKNHIYLTIKQLKDYILELEVGR